MDEKKFRELLKDYKDGNIDEDNVLKTFQSIQYDDLGFAKVDRHRELRNGYPEVIYAEGKATEHVLGIVKSMVTNGKNILLTRVSKELADAVMNDFPESEYHEIARILIVNKAEHKPTKHKILVCTGGTSDISVAEEAALTAEVLGNSVMRLYDVGVAGIHRLLSNQEILKEASVIIAVAGMEGALPSVVGGLVDVPVIAVPTSVGYGAHFDGLASLLAMLNSCASGIGVVNIDNGFGAGYLASSFNRLLEKASNSNE